MTSATHRPRHVRRRNRLGHIALLASGVLVASIGTVSVAEAATAPNLAPNASVEKAARSGPVSWIKVGEGVNKRRYSYVKSKAAANGKRFVRTTVTSRKSGAAGWTFTPVKVVAGATYTYSDSYRSNKRTALRLRMVNSKGKVTLRTLATSPISSKKWRKSTVTFTVPAGITKVSVERLITSVGFVDVDNVGLRLKALPKKPAPKPVPKPTVTPKPTTPVTPKPSTPATQSAPMVSITLDDGTADQYSNAAPVLDAAGLDGTFYLVSDYLGEPGYMTDDQARALKAGGHELGSHTRTHVDLTTVHGADLTNQLKGAKDSLESRFGSITSLAYPYGNYNSEVLAEVAKYYSTARTTEGGQQTKSTVKPLQILMRYVTNQTTTADVQTWMNEARSKNAWTVLVYHHVEANPDTAEGITPATFAAQIKVVKDSGIKVATVSQAYGALK